MEHSNERFELLTQGGEESDDSDEIQRFVRRRRYNRLRQSRTCLKLHSAEECYSKFCLPIVCSFFIGLTVWVFILTWAAIQLRIEMQTLRNITETVSASNDGIPESIQKCHKLTKQLEKNQTKIINQLQIVAQTLTNFSNMISGIQADLSKVEKKLDESQPQLNVHNTLQTLTSNVASFRDQIDELQSKVASISDIQAQMKTLVKSMNANVSSIHNDLQDLKKESSEKSPSEKINKESIVSLVTGNIDPEIKTVNNTLWSQVKLLSDDLHEVQKIINNLTEESAYFKTNIETIYNSLSEKNVNLNILRDEVKDYYKDWKQSIKETRDIQSNITKFWRSCSQCKYLYNEESATGISPASEMSTSTTNMIPNTTVV